MRVGGPLHTPPKPKLQTGISLSPDLWTLLTQICQCDCSDSMTEAKTPLEVCEWADRERAEIVGLTTHVQTELRHNFISSLGFALSHCSGVL